MEIKELYRYEREPGKITVSTVKPDVEYTITYRIIAAEGKAVTQNGTDIITCVDTDNKDGWYEVDLPEEQNTEASQ